VRDYYSEMSQGGLQHEKGFGASLGQWMEITGKGYDHDKDSGWKFKVSVAHDDVPKAWNIVADILLNQIVPQAAAVVRPERLSQMRADQSKDKAIIIDTSRDVTPVRYMMILNHIDQELRKAGIKPADTPLHEKQIENSPYLSYGWDLPPRGIYNPDVSTKKSYNPSTQTDPYQAFKVDGDPAVAEAAVVKRRLPPMLPADSKEKEFVRHHWHDAQTGGGQALVRLPILGMEMDRVRRIQQELIGIGLKYELSDSKELGCLTIRLRGEDAERFRKINPAVPHYLQKEWQGAQDGGGQKITRLPVQDMSDGDFVRVVMGLKDAGFNPVEHISATLGKTIRLTGAEAERLERMRENVPAYLKPPQSGMA